jgi:excisionase family DNA binding protein
VTNSTPTPEDLIMTNPTQGPESRLTVRPREMARMLGVSLRTLQNWMAQRGLPHMRIGRMVLLDPHAVQQWLQSVNERNTGP